MSQPSTGLKSQHIIGLMTCYNISCNSSSSSSSTSCCSIICSIPCCLKACLRKPLWRVCHKQLSQLTQACHPQCSVCVLQTSATVTLVGSWALCLLDCIHQWLPSINKTQQRSANQSAGTGTLGAACMVLIAGQDLLTALLLEFVTKPCV